MQSIEPNPRMIIELFKSQLPHLGVVGYSLERTRLFYRLASGVELTTKSGKKSTFLPIGPFFGYMLSVLKGIPAPAEAEDPFVAIRYTGEYLEDLCEAAKDNVVARNAAEELAACFLKQDGKLPSRLIPITTQALEVGKYQKKTRGRHPLETLYRDAPIAMLIQGVVETGFSSVTRNDEPRNGKKNSICDLMCQALEEIKRPLTYTTIKDIWRRREELLKYAPPFRLSFEKDSEGRPACYMGYANPFK